MKQRFLPIFALLCGLLLGLGLLTWAGGKFRSVDPATLGFAVNSTGIGNEHYEGRLVSGFSSSLATLCAGARQWQAEGYRVALWLGNSQLYTIVNYAPGQHLAVHDANAAAAKAGSKLRFVQLAAPNANLNELLALYLACRQRGFVPDVLVLGLVYKNLNDRGIRPDIATWVATLPTRELATLGGAAQALATTTAPAETSLADPPPDRDKTLAARIEDQLDARLAAVWPVFRERDQLRAAMEAALTRDLASLVFAFSPNKRPVVRVSPEAQDWNMRAFASLVQVAARDQAPMFVYQVPHQPGLHPFYYVRADYDAFYAGLQAACATDHVHFADLERLVPSLDWRGLTQFHLSDCFHFQTEGHELLGNAVAKTILSLTDH